MNYKVSRLAALTLFVFLVQISACRDNRESAKEICLPEELIVLNQSVIETNNHSEHPDVFILFNIDCAKCLEEMSKVEGVIKNLIERDNRVSLVLSGENLGFFMETFPDIINTTITVYYDRYNTFIHDNSIENNGNILLVFASLKGKIKSISLNQYVVKNRSFFTTEL